MGKQNKQNFEEKKDLSSKKQTTGRNDSRKYGSKDTNPAGSYEAGKKGVGHNDPKWLYTSPLLLKLLASIPTLVVAGKELVFTNTAAGFEDGGIHLANRCGRGIVVDIVPTAGGNQYRDIMALQTYLRQRGDLTGQTSFEQADVFMYDLAYGSCLLAIGYMAKMFKLVDTFITQNVMFPSGFISAMSGWTASELTLVQRNLVGYYGWLNLQIAKLETMKVPADITYFTRCLWFASGIYTDQEGLAAANIYTYVPRSVFKYNATKTPAGGGLDYLDFAHTTLSAQMANLENMIQALINDTDCQNISAFMRKAYDESSLFSLDLYEKTKLEMPTNAEVLFQIHNLGIAPFKVTKANASQGVGVGQLNGVIQYTDMDLSAAFVTGQSGAATHLACVSDHVIMDSFSNPVTEEEYLTSTRLIPAYKLKDGMLRWEGDLFAATGYTIVTDAGSRTPISSQFSHFTTPDIYYSPICYDMSVEGDLMSEIRSYDGCVQNVTVISMPVLCDLNYATGLAQFGLPHDVK